MTYRMLFAILPFLVIGVAHSQPRTRNHLTLSSNGISSQSNANQTLPYSSEFKITVSEKKTTIKANGIPNHKVGIFPNSGNPNSIQPQSYTFTFPTHPHKSAQQNLHLGMNFGVAVNGVPFDPAAAEWYKGERNSSYSYEALSGAIELGVDQNNAHVQPNGAYHYHGLPTLLLQSLDIKKGSPSKLVGYAADGFKIYALYDEKGDLLHSSYRLKKGSRPIGGTYDGTFNSDYEYISGGDLDECNGKDNDGEYSYFLTQEYPYIPRCFKGTPDSSFRHQALGQAQQQRQQEEKNHSSRVGGRRAPPQKAIQACDAKSSGAFCSFKAAHGTVRGTCFNPPSGGLACRP